MIIKSVFFLFFSREKEKSTVAEEVHNTTGVLYTAGHGEARREATGANFFTVAS